MKPSLFKTFFVLILLTIFFSEKINAQGVAVGSWRMHTSMQDVIAVADGGDRIFAATGLSVFAVMKADHSIIRYDKSTGMNDVGVSAIGYNTAAQCLVVAYKNSDIDIITQSGIVNLADISRKNIPGNKSINSIFNDGSKCYLSCGYGISIIDLNKMEFADTYIIGANGNAINVMSTAVADGLVCAATVNGLAVIDATNPNISNYSAWTYWNKSVNQIPDSLKKVFVFGNKCLAQFGDSIGELNPITSKWNFKFHPTNLKIETVASSATHLMISETDTITQSSKIIFLNKNFTITQTLADPTFIGTTTDLVEDISTGEVWFGNRYQGLTLEKDKHYERIVPNAPLYNTAWAMAEKDGVLWTAAGSVSGAFVIYSYNTNGFYSFSDENWNSYNRYDLAGLNNVQDLICVAPESKDHVYFGSYGYGLIEFNNGVCTTHTTDVGLQPAIGDLNSYRIADMKMDASNNLWMTNWDVGKPLVVKKADGTFTNFSNPYGINFLGKMIIDKQGQIWAQALKGGSLLVYNPGSDINSTADDSYRILNKGGGVGNLPSSEVTALAEDKDGQIWVGTAEGIGIFYDAAHIIEGGDAQQIIVSKDSINAYLFASEVINDIKIDGANRKWIATTHGVWLISADGLTELYHFNEDNSPLLSNNVITIGIQSKTGEVFFGTEKGICSFKSTATGGGEKNETVLVYPNPVPHNYDGIIAIRGLVENAYVKITDVNGVLIYSTRALGGQAVWDGNNLKGEKTSSGIYLVFATNGEGSETAVAKFLYEK